MKTFGKMLVGAILAAALTYSAAAGFEKTLVYAEGQFSDVPAAEWYAAEVRNTYELGLMNGKGEGKFDPDGNVTVAEALTIASRASAAYGGETIPEASGEWYQMYVNYAESKGMIQKGAYKAEDYDRPAKRYEVATFFAHALPKEAYAAKNTVTYIPDVTPSRPYYEDVLMLYKAGIVMGSDSFGTFNPEHNIIRAEAAAIINRAALPENRLTKTLDVVSQYDAYLLNYTAGNYNTPFEGIASGWVLDNRGGSPRSTLMAPYGSLYDVYDDSGTAMIREFNKITTGVLDLELDLTVTNGVGTSLEFRNEDGQAVYDLRITDDGWCLKGSDGGYVKVADYDENVTGYAFRITLDVDNARAITVINGTPCGTSSLIQTGKKANLLNFRVATDDEHKPSVILGACYMWVNYPFYQHHEFSVPAGESKTYRFENAGGDKVISEFQILFDARQPVAYKVCSDDKEIAVFTSDDKAFYVNGVKVYENYYNTMYYRFRLEMDMNKCEMLVKVNGVGKATVPFMEKAASVNTVVVDNSGNGTALNLMWGKVFRYIEHEDYVPVPVVPKGEEKWTVGINSCNIWFNGYNTQGGWSCITPYDEIRPAIGYYDDISPETADWEIKYLVEHGVDFQAMCIFFGSTTSARQVSCYHLFDGFMNARYADMSHFAVLWENNGGVSPANLDVFKTQYVPYFIENFFKHPSYMTINNKPVFIVYSADVLASRFGGAAGVKEALDYLEAEVKKLGFDGLIKLANTSCSAASYKEMGFDAVYAYGWGIGGDTPSICEDLMTESAEVPNSAYTIPVACVGYSFHAWEKEVLYGNMSYANWDVMHDWICDEYLPKYAKQDWQRSFVMLSNWNEYGEGTYIMPTTAEGGFGYLDGVRTHYTDEAVDPSLDLYPTASQLGRITHLYPQYRRLLRRDRRASDALRKDDLVYIGTINGDNYGFANGIAGITRNGTTVEGITTNKDPNFFFNYFPEAKYTLDDIVAIEVTSKAPAGCDIVVFYISDTHPAWSGSQCALEKQPDGNGYRTVLINTSGAANFDGTLTCLRVDVGNIDSQDVGVEQVRLFTYNDNIPSRYINIDGVRSLLTFTPIYSETGDMLVPFDPALGFDFQLRLFHLWDSEKQTLTLYGTEHTFVFTVGSDTYLIDGVRKSLGYTLPSIDHLPYVPLDRVCDVLGYDFSVNLKKEITVVTPLKDYYDEKAASRVFGQWEFNYAGDPENWMDPYGGLTLTAMEGFMRYNSTTSDPISMLNGGIILDTSRYTKFEVRCRYEFAADNWMVMFFGTNGSGITGDNVIQIPLGTSSGGDWVTYTVDLTALDCWKDTVTELRFDPFTGTGSMDVDYIRFIE